jgi:hypothetical protein
VGQRGGRRPPLANFIGLHGETPPLVVARRSYRRRQILAAVTLGTAAAVTPPARSLVERWRPATGGPGMAAVPPGDTASPPLPGARLLHTAPGRFTSLAVVSGATGEPIAYVADSLNGLFTAGSTALTSVPGFEGSSATALLAARGGSLLWLAAPGAVREITPDGRTATLTLQSGAWRTPVAIRAYGGNLYVLDPGANDDSGQIWRYPGQGGGFDPAAQTWLQPGSASLAGATSFAVDGAIWVARQDGAILRLNGGRPEPFDPRGLDPPIVAAGGIYTEPAHRSVYVVDSAARRVVQLAKDGEFEREVREAFPVGEVPRGLWVDTATGRGLLLTDQNLFEFVMPGQ